MTVSSLTSSPAMNPAMPQNMEPLSAEEVELFRRWILEGAHDDTPAEVDDMADGKLSRLYRTAGGHCTRILSRWQHTRSIRCPRSFIV